MSSVQVQSASGAVYTIDYNDYDTVSTLKHRLRQRDWDAWVYQDKLNKNSNSNSPTNKENNNVYDDKYETETSISHANIDSDDNEFDILLSHDGNKLSNNTPISIINNNNNDDNKSQKLYYKLNKYPTYAQLLTSLLKYNKTNNRIILWSADILLVFIGSLFIAAFAQASFNLPQSWSTYIDVKDAVPITFQTFAVLVIANLYGCIRGFLAVGVYACLIAMGGIYNTKVLIII